MILGVHNSINGELTNAIDECIYLKTNASQIFIHSPRQWLFKEIDKKQVKTFIEKRKQAKIEKLIIHSSYLIYPLSKNKETIEKSKQLLLTELKNSQDIEADYYVMHIKENKELSIVENEKNIYNFFKDIKTEKTKILIENSAAGLYSDFKNIYNLYNILKKLNIFAGFCLDTAHAFEGGYNIRKENGLENLIKDIKDLNLIKMIHLNDSKTDLNSKLDRHHHIGKGKISIDGFKTFFKIKEFKEKPLILETPKTSLKDDKKNLETIRKLI